MVMLGRRSLARRRSSWRRRHALRSGCGAEPCSGDESQPRREHGLVPQPGSVGQRPCSRIGVLLGRKQQVQSIGNGDYTSYPRGGARLIGERGGAAGASAAEAALSFLRGVMQRPRHGPRHRRWGAALRRDSAEQWSHQSRWVSYFGVSSGGEEGRGLGGGEGVGPGGELRDRAAAGRGSVLAARAARGASLCVATAMAAPAGGVRAGPVVG